MGEGEGALRSATPHRLPALADASGHRERLSGTNLPSVQCDMTLSPLSSPSLICRPFTVHGRDVSLPAVQDIIWSGSTNGIPIYYFLDFCPLLICHIQKHACIKAHTSHIRAHGPQHSVFIWSPPTPSLQQNMHCLPSEETLIRNESFWSVAVGCQIWTDIIIPKNNTSLPPFNIHSHTFSLPLCVRSTARVPKGVLLARNPNGLYPVAENTRHPRTPVILCSFFFFLWLKYNVETLLFLAFPAPAAPFTLNCLMHLHYVSRIGKKTKTSIPLLRLGSCLFFPC